MLARSRTTKHTSAPVALAVLAMLTITGCTAPATTQTSATDAAISAPAPTVACATLPEDYSFLSDIDPSIAVDLRYAGPHNFTGETVDGYDGATDVVLRTDAATALAAVHQQFATQGIGLLVYDGFRPTRAVDHFVAWSHTPDDRTKAEFYPNLEKEELFAQGYIATESNHSRGGTVDLTLVQLDSGDPLDMGGTFDLFDERSHGDAAMITEAQASNRELLRNAMMEAGFAPYAEEWWHYSYPVPETAERADFPLRHCATQPH